MWIIDPTLVTVFILPLTTQTDWSLFATRRRFKSELIIKLTIISTTVISILNYPQINLKTFLSHVMKEWAWFSKKMFFFDSIYMTGTIASIYRTFIISDWFCFIYLIFKLFDSRRQISAWSWSQFSDLELDIFFSISHDFWQ